MSAALVNRSLSTLKTELEFLKDSNVITENFFNQVVSNLPDRYQNGAEPIDFPVAQSATSIQSLPKVSNESVFNEKQSLTAQSTATLTTSQFFKEEYAEALYDYAPQEPEDLGLRSGDKIKVLERVSPDWWRGDNNGRIGMFPSNYVKVLPNNNSSSQLPSYSKPQSSVSPSPQQQFYSPPPQQQQYYQPPLQQQQQYYQQPPPPQQMVQYQNTPPQQVTVVQGEAQQTQGNSTNQELKKFGSKLGNAAIFGAGATLGADLVNSIF